MTAPSSPTRKTTALAAFDLALRDDIGLSQSESLDAWLEAPRSYLRPEGLLRMAGHFDIRPAFVILDQRLATWGLVAFVDDASEDDVRRQVKQHVDSAAYARHLIVKRAAAERKAPITIELALIAVSDATIQCIGSALRDLLRGTDSLYQIGVGVLQHDEKTAYRGRLRRALPWLLTATKQWFDSPRSSVPAGATAAPSGRGRLSNLRLSNYRLNGERDLELHRDHRVHLIHGPNGSGKSSLVEAIELVSRGRIDRIDRAEEKDYARVIRNRSASAPARVALKFDGADAWHEGEVTSTGFSAALAVELSAGSFRIDQPLMERLVGLYPHERAKNFLEAFFPEAFHSLRLYEAADDRLEVVITSLQSTVDQLARARAVLLEISAVRTLKGVRSTEPYVMLLNRYLELTALIDTADREQQARMILHTARASGWTGRRNEAAAFASLEPDDELPTAIHRWTLEKSALQTKLASFRPTSRSSQQLGETIRGLTADQIEALNSPSHWLFDERTLQSLGQFGDRVDQVFSAQESATYGDTVIGTERWTESIIARLDAMLAACAGLQSNAVTPWPGYGHCSDFEAAALKQQELLSAGEALSAVFISQLQPDEGRTGEFDGSLIAALNELLALFTPARWGYEDIELPSDVSHGRLSVRLAIGVGQSAPRAELHLNTAALNLFTVALFLLCAGRVAKPLPLLIFDDPLQNMDELTTTALARGLARLVRLWQNTKRTEELLFLFHGTEDLRRFQEELPSTTYRLPWLSPSARDDQKQKITADAASTWQSSVLALDTIVTAAGL